MPKIKKIFIIDTNVILQNSSCIHCFDENDIILLIVVLEEVDHPYLSLRSNGLSTLFDKIQGQKIYAHIDLQKGERSELAEVASNILYVICRKKETFFTPPEKLHSFSTTYLFY